MPFSKDFLWGAASAAYQIEGAYKEDKKGLGIWDVLAREKDIMPCGEMGDVASDHYHHWKEDVALMKQLGLKTYRFSISWPRVLPNGIGAVNEKGLDFYSQLVDELVKAGIEPIVTLYHWDLPMELHKMGGWKNRDIVAWFAEYTKVIVDRLSDRVAYWITINEPQMFVGLGYLLGVHAPFERNCPETIISISHNVLLAHGTAVKVIRENAKKAPKIGMAPTGDVYIPVNDTAEEIAVAKEKSFAFDSYAFSLGNAWWADPVFLGDYPKQAYEQYPEAMKQVTKGDLELIKQELDFYGFNAYNGTTSFHKKRYSDNAYQGSPKTFTMWDVTPKVLYWAPKFLYERYQKPLLITENGMAGMDWVSLDGKVHDMQRIDFLHRYLLELRRGMLENIPVIGYTCWSLMDNLEWNKGYDMRFGLVYIDYRTLKRVIKDSGYWYAKVISTNGKSLLDYDNPNGEQKRKE